MTPFQQFRVWLRQAPAGDRIATATAAVIAAALLLWIIVPPGRASTSTAGADASVTSDQAAPSTSPPTAAVAPVSAGGAASAEAATAVGTPGAVASPTPGNTAAVKAAGGCLSPPGSDQGVTATEITVGVAISELAGPAGNAAFGVPSGDEQRAGYQAVFDGVNAAGGVACHKLVPKYVTINGADQSDQQAKCLEFGQQKVFAVLDAGAYYTPPSAKTCFAIQDKLPFLSSALLSGGEQRQYYPYLYSVSAQFENVYRNTALALAHMGFFDPSKGFVKLGVIWRDCAPDINRSVIAFLHEAGVPDSKIVIANVGCPTGFASPSDLAQAVLHFQQQGVTHVTTAQFVSDFGNFTKIAAQQGFRPRWGLPEDGIIAITGSAYGPSPQDIANAIVVTANRYGEEHDNLPAGPATDRCNAMFHAAGLPDVQKQLVAFGGVICNQVWMFAAAVNHARTLTRTAIAAGLQLAGSVEFSYPGAPNDFRAKGTTFAGQFWRPIRMDPGCSCWRVIDPTFHPSL